MRMVVDLQACQTRGSRHRGIGRYSMSLLKAMLRRAHGHEVHVLLNGSFPEAIADVRRNLNGLIDMARLHVWRGLEGVAAANPGHRWSLRAAEALRNAFIASMQPDIVHVSSLFEGLTEDAVISVNDGAGFDSAVTLYDLIPLVNRDVYLVDPVAQGWYLDKLSSLRRARLLLAISESSRREAIEHLALDASRVANVSAAADPMFRKLPLSRDAEQSLRAKFGLHRDFVMYTGGIDHRKNIEGLIRAYALLPGELRRDHQLTIVCHARDEDKVRLVDLASKSGLTQDEVVFTGFVSDEELVLLCNLCTLFVFPSWHEGFGLPALEAMACGAPVIAANTSSLPEVIGRSDALFDPRDDDAIASAMAHALMDQSYLQELSRHGLQQAQRFTWDESAKRAIETMEAAVRPPQQRRGPIGLSSPAKLRMAYVSPIPPERSGIAAYSEELLPALAAHYDIEIINDLTAATGSGEWHGIPVRTVEWLFGNAAYYDRVLYHFGNSSFHGHMFELLRKIPGVVVLHDFFLAHLVRHIEFTGEDPGTWWAALYESHGYPAVLQRAGGRDGKVLVTEYPCNWQIFADADGVIVHSDYSRSLAHKWYGSRVDGCIRVVPHLRKPVARPDRDAACLRRGIPADAFVVATLGIVTSAKLAHRLLDVWNADGWSADPGCILVLAGDVPDPDYSALLNARMPRDPDSRQRVILTGYLEDGHYRDLLIAADVAVQLRTDTRGETSGAVLDCLAYGLATIVNAHGPMVELPEGVVRVLPDNFTNVELGRALSELREDPSKRERLAYAGRTYLERELAPARIAEACQEAIESLVKSSPRRQVSWLVRAVSMATEGTRATEPQLVSVARSIAENFPVSRCQRQLFVDLSTLVVVDARSGIQRVVRSVLARLLASVPAGLRVEPVYTDGSGVYRYARNFTATYLGLPTAMDRDSEIEACPGDIFLGLDLAAHLVPGMVGYFHRLRSCGVSLQFVLYDLLPALRPQWFPRDLVDHMQRWYRAITDVADRVIAISRSVADEYCGWLEASGLAVQSPRIGYFHLGADIETSRPSVGVDATTLRKIGAIDGPTVLMVGTIEPRNGHAEALDAFERLWASGIRAHLVVVGKRGWHMEAFAERMERHIENGHHLHWFEGVSDAALECLYDRSSLLLAASLAEGFGLPLIEAASRGLPLLVRDIPVFREVAGDGALYFEAGGPESLARSIEDALEAAETRSLPDPRSIRVLSWAESVEQLLNALDGRRDV